MLPPLPTSAANSADYTRASIRTRLARQVAELWGYAEADLDGFDPLVNLLLEACAVEFEKLGQELQSTQARLLERLAALLNPDVVDAPRPAYAVAQARAREARTTLPADTQLVFEPATVGRQAAGQSLYFSPLQTTTLLNGAVRCLATDEAAWLLGANGQRRLVAQAPAPLAPAEHRRLWLGLSLPAAELPTELLIYFDWLNEPRRAEYLAQLPAGQWLLADTVLATHAGLPTAADAPAASLDGEYDLLLRLEQHVRDLYAASFVQVSLPAAALAAYAPRPYPAELAAALGGPAALTGLTQPLHWLELRLPHSLPPVALTEVTCALNCFPVLNRRLHRVLYRLQPALNLFPLPSDEPFLAVRDVYSLAGVSFRATTLRDLTEGATDTYTLRSQGVGRFDSRDSHDTLRELLSLLRDESQAFTAAGTDFVGNILRELDQSMARLEERLDRQRTTGQPVPYLLLRPRDVRDSVYLEYWSSAGVAANRLPAGSPLRVLDGHYVEEVRLLTTTAGGHERPHPEERTYALRRNLLARNRLVTLADIEAACWADLGRELAAVQIEKAFRAGATATAGFVRCIRVRLTPAATSRLTAPEWQHAAEALQAQLSSLSALNLPYEVVVESAEPLLSFGGLGGARVG